MTYTQLVKSKEFLDSTPEQKAAQVKDHWDRAEAAAPSEQVLQRIQQVRGVAEAGKEAWDRANNVKGNLTEGDRATALEEAKRYDAAFSLLGTGAAYKSPEAAQRVENAMGEIEQIRQKRMDELNRQREEAIKLTEERGKMADEFTGYLNEQGMFGSAVQAMNASDKGITVKADGGLETPVIFADTPENPRSGLQKMGDLLVQHGGQRSGSESLLTTYNSDFPAALKKLQEEKGWSVEQIQTAWNDVSSNVKGWGDSERIRVKSNGEIRINPAGAVTLDTDELKKEILAAPTSDIHKKAAMISIDQIQHEAASELMMPLAAWSSGKPWRENFMDTATKELQEGKKTPAAIVRDYVKRNKLSQFGPNTIFDKLISEGTLKFTGWTTGGLAKLTGSDLLAESAVRQSEASDLYARSQDALVGERNVAGTFLAGALAEAPGLVPMALLSGGAGLLARSSFGVLNEGAVVAGRMTAAEAAASTAASVRVAAQIASTGTAGAQSMSMTYTDVMKQEMAKGLTPDEAHKIAVPQAEKAGLSTALITGAFGLIGAGGLEKSVANMSVREFAEAAAAKGVTAEAAAKSMFRRVLSTGAALGSKLKGGIGEYGEEALDEFVSPFLSADPNTPIVDAFKNAHQAGIVGFGMGGVSSVLEGIAEAKDPKNRTQAERDALRQAAPVQTAPHVHEIWEDANGKRIGLNIEKSGLVTRLVEQSDGSWSPAKRIEKTKDEDGNDVENEVVDQKTRDSTHRQLVREGYNQRSAARFDKEGNVEGHALLIGPEGEKESQEYSAGIRIHEQRQADKRKASLDARFDRDTELRRKESAERRARMIEDVKNMSPEQRRESTTRAIDDMIALQEMLAKAPETAEADAAGRPAAQRLAGLFDYNAVSGGPGDPISAPEGSPVEIHNAVEALARNNITSKTMLAAALNSPFMKGSPSRNTEVTKAAMTLLNAGALEGFGVLPEGVERDANGELVATPDQEGPAPAYDKAAFTAAETKLTTQIADLEKLAAAEPAKGKSKAAIKKNAAIEAAKEDLPKKQAELVELREARADELAKLRGRETRAERRAREEQEMNDLGVLQPDPNYTAEERNAYIEGAKSVEGDADARMMAAFGAVDALRTANAEAAAKVAKAIADAKEAEEKAAAAVAKAEADLETQRQAVEKAAQLAREAALAKYEAEKLRKQKEAAEAGDAAEEAKEEAEESVPDAAAAKAEADAKRAAAEEEIRLAAELAKKKRDDEEAELERALEEVRRKDREKAEAALKEAQARAERFKAEQAARQAEIEKAEKEKAEAASAAPRGQDDFAPNSPSNEMAAERKRQESKLSEFQKEVMFWLGSIIYAGQVDINKGKKRLARDISFAPLEGQPMDEAKRIALEKAEEFGFITNLSKNRNQFRMTGNESKMESVISPPMPVDVFPEAFEETEAPPTEAPPTEEAPPTTPPVEAPPAAMDQKERTKIEAFIEVVDENKTGGEEPSVLKRRADKALKNGWIKQSDHDEIMRISKEQVAEAKRESTKDDKVEPDLDEAWNLLLTSLQYGLDSGTAPSSPTPDTTPPVEPQTPDAGTTATPEAGAPPASGTPAEEASPEAPPVDGPMPEAGATGTPAATPEPRFPVGSRQQRFAILTREDLLEAQPAIAAKQGNMFEPVGRNASKDTPSPAMEGEEGILATLVGEGILTEEEALAISGKPWRDQVTLLLAKLDEALGMGPPVQNEQRAEVKTPPTTDETNTTQIIKNNKSAKGKSTKAKGVFQSANNKDSKPRPETKKKVAEVVPDEKAAEGISKKVTEQGNPDAPEDKTDPDDPDDGWGERKDEAEEPVEDNSPPGPLEHDDNGVPISHQTRSRTPVEQIGGKAASPTLPSKAVHKLLRQMSRRFGIRFDWKDLPEGMRGRFVRGTARVELSNSMNISSETPVHEIMHAFLAAIRRKNEALYHSMLKELDDLIDGDPQLQRIRAEVIDTYNEDNENTLQEEVMVAYLSRNADALITERYWKDQSSWAAKGVANKMWSLVRDMLSSMFRGNRASVATINQFSTLEDIAALLVNPETRLDLTDGIDRGLASSRTMLLEHAIGVKAAAQAVLDSLHDTSKGVMALTRDSRGKLQISITISDGWESLSQAISGLIGPIRGSFGSEEKQAEFHRRWAEHKDHALDDDFWRGFENVRRTVQNVTGRRVLNHAHIGHVLDLLGTQFSEAVESGKPDFQTMHRMLQLRDELMTKSPTFVSAAIARIPGAAISPMMAAFSNLGSVDMNLDGNRQGEMVPLSEEAIAQIKDLMQQRIEIAEHLSKMAEQGNLSRAEANEALQKMWTDEFAAAIGISNQTGVNPLASKGYSMEDYVARRIDPKHATWANRQLRGTIGKRKPAPPSPPPTEAPPKKEFKEKVETTLTDEEKSEAAKELGFMSWGARASEAFQQRFADWMVSAKEASKVLTKMFGKVLAAMKAATLAGVAFVSFVNVPPANIKAFTVSSMQGSDLSVTQGGFTGTTGAMELARPDFGKTKVSRDVRRFANWVVGRGDHEGLPFSVTDKNAGTTTFFDGNGKLTHHTASLTGQTRADTPTKEQEQLSIEELETNPGGKITPTGKHRSVYHLSSEYGDTIRFLDHKSTMLLVHQVYLEDPSEHRDRRLATEGGKDNNISFGCINIPAKVAKEVAPAYKKAGGFTYVLPVTPEGQQVFEGFGDTMGDSGGDYDYAKTRSSKPVPPSTAPVKPPKRFGDGTKDGLHAAIANNSAFSFAQGHKIMPKADGTPSGPFHDISHAYSFAAIAAAKEGIEETELKIWKTTKGGVVSYHVIVPNPMGNGNQQRLGHMWSPTTLGAALSQALRMPHLPTLAEMQELMISNPLAMRKLIRRAQQWNLGRHPEDPDTHDDIDFLKQQNEIDQVVLLNKYHQYLARSYATSVVQSLRARHKGAFIIDVEDVTDPDYGKVTNMQLKPGQSPYLSDILQKAMVDPHAYNLSPAQTEMVNDFRSVLEQMRGLMIDAQIDRKFLDQHGLDSGNYLNKPEGGKDTWREYFPRMVRGWVTPGGRFEPKQFLGMGSTKTDVKGYEKARIVGPDGKPQSMEQIKSNPETAHITYEADPFEAINHFLTNAYSAIASTDLAQNLQPFAQPGNTATLQKSFVRDVNVLNSLFDEQIAAYLRKELIEKQTTSSVIQKVESVALKSKSIVLGVDLAVALTTAGAFTLGHIVQEIMRGHFVSGFTDVAGLFATSVKESVIPAFMSVINGKVKDSVNSIDGFDKLWKGNEQYFSELATLWSLLGSTTDYDEQVKALQQNAESQKSKSGKLTAKARALSLLGGLQDFHRNYATFAKMLMWKGMRERYVDSATGELRTDKDSVQRMMKDIRGLDRALGYSADMQLSTISANMKGALRILLTAPTMYLSMGKALVTPSGLKQIGPMMIGGLMFFFLAGKSADMEDDELLARMDPRHKYFMTLDVKLPSGNVIHVKMSNFYASIIALVGKETDVAQRAVAGEVITLKDFKAPVAMFGQGRLSTFAAGVMSMITGKDFMDRECSIVKSAANMFIPASINEPLLSMANRVLGLEGTPWIVADMEQQYTVTEKHTLADNATIFAGQVLGLNVYGSRETYAINNMRNEMSEKRLGVKFDDIPPEKFGEALKIIDDVAKARGSPEKFGGFDVDKAKREAWATFTYRELSPEIRRMVAQAGLTGRELEVPGLIITKGKQNAFLTGTTKAAMWKAAAYDMQEKEKGLRWILETRVREEGCKPMAVREEIKDAINASTKADNKRVQSMAGLKY